MSVRGDGGRSKQGELNNKRCSGVYSDMQCQTANKRAAGYSYKWFPNNVRRIGYNLVDR